MSNKKSFNQKLYANTITTWIPDINPQDLKWLCNKSAELYKSVEAAGCVDNYRVSRVVDGFVSCDYVEARDSGCCGSCDEQYVNPITGNTFSIGFNFGH